MFLGVVLATWFDPNTRMNHREAVMSIDPVLSLHDHHRGVGDEYWYQRSSREDKGQAFRGVGGGGGLFGAGR